MMKTIGEELIALCRAFGLFERDAVCCGDVSVSQCVALQFLLERPRDVSTLASTLGVTVSASTRLIDGMKQRGWVTRRRDPEDRRRVLVHLSEAGAEQAAQLSHQTSCMIDAVLRHIPASRHAQVRESLNLVREALERCCAEDASCCS